MSRRTAAAVLLLTGLLATATYGLFGGSKEPAYDHHGTLTTPLQSAEIVRTINDWFANYSATRKDVRYVGADPAGLPDKVRGWEVLKTGPFRLDFRVYCILVYVRVTVERPDGTRQEQQWHLTMQPDRDWAKWRIDTVH